VQGKGFKKVMGGVISQVCKTLWN